MALKVCNDAVGFPAVKSGILQSVFCLLNYCVDVMLMCIN